MKRLTNKNTEADDETELDVLPHHGALEMRRLVLERRRVAVEALCLVNKHVDLVAALQDLLDVVHHDGLDLVDLRARLAQFVSVRVV